MGRTRRGFLGSGAAVVGGAALAGAWRPAEAAAATTLGPMKEIVTEGAFGPGFDGEFFYFQFAGEGPGGFLQSVAGGIPEADVIAEPAAGSAVIKKHIGQPRYGDITVECNVGRNKGFYDWIKSSLDRKADSRRGSIIAVDKNLRATAAADFTHGLVTEIGFPALDASSKDPAFMTIKFSPGATHVKAAIAVIPFPNPPKPLKTTFKLAIDGLDTSRVTSIEAFTVKQRITENAAGEFVALEQEIPNLAIWFEDEPNSIQSWVEFFDSFVVKGSNGDDRERTGTLSYMDPARPGTLLDITLENMGIFRLTPEKVESGSDNVRRVKAEMYCEDITFNYGAAWA